MRDTADLAPELITAVATIKRLNDENERLHEQIEQLSRKLDAIAKHPDTPPFLKQYAEGRLDPC